MKIAYCDPKNLRNSTRILLDDIIRILEDYKEQGYKLTLRQLYYQLVSSDILENKVQNYSKLSRILTDADYVDLYDEVVQEENQEKHQLEQLVEGLNQ